MRPVAATGTTRRARRNMRLSGYHVPKGTLLLVPFDAVHHHPDNWADPDAFIPVPADRPSLLECCLPSEASSGASADAHSAALPSSQAEHLCSCRHVS